MTGRQSKQVTAGKKKSPVEEIQSRTCESNLGRLTHPKTQVCDRTNQLAKERTAQSTRRAALQFASRTACSR